MSTASDKIIDRIQKLRRLSESTNVNEAALAAAEAQRLMTEHRLSEAEIASTSGTEDDTVIDVDVLAATGMRRPQSWLVTLAGLVAEANGCRISIQSGWRTRLGSTAPGAINMYGRPSDIDSAKYLFFAMKNEIDRLADIFVAANPGGGRGATISFKYGAASEIGARMVNQNSARMKTAKAAADMGNSAATNALLVIDKRKKDVDAAVDRRCSGGGTWGGSGPSNGGAYRAGRQMGAGVNIGGNRSIGSAPKQIGGRP